MKKRCYLLLTICLLIFSNSRLVFAGYGKPYYMNLYENKITTFGKEIPTFYRIYESKGTFMLPLSEIFSACGFQTNVNNEEKNFVVIINQEELEIDGNNMSMSFDKFQKKLMVEPIFMENECYVSFYDLVGIFDYDKEIKCFSWNISDDFSDKIKGVINSQGDKDLYRFYQNKNFINKYNTCILLDTEIYNIEGFLMLPVRSFFKEISKDSIIEWDSTKKVAQIKINNKEIILDVANEKIYINGESISYYGSLDIQDDRLFIPLRNWIPVLNKLGYSVSNYDIYWDNVEKKAVIRI